MNPEEQLELEAQIRQAEIDRIDAQTQQFQEQQNAPATADQVSGQEYESPNEAPTQPQPQPETQNIDGLVVEPTKPTVVEMITKIAFSPIGLTVLGLVGLGLVVSGFKKE